MAGRPWIKLHTRWLTSPSHARLKGGALGTGMIFLLLLADQGEDDSDGGRWFPLKARSSCVEDVIDYWLSCGRVRLDSGRRHVQSLLECETFAISKGGRLGMPNWAKWQENPSAKRVRKHRAKGVTVTREEEEEVEEDVDAEARNTDTEKKAKPDIEYELLSTWAVYGGDPLGLGPWPSITLPSGQKTKLITTAKLADMMLPGRYKATEVHQVVHDLASMVEDGSFPKSQYKPSYVFSGYFADLLLKVAEWRAQKAQVAQSVPRGEPDPAEVKRLLEEWKKGKQ